MMLKDFMRVMDRVHCDYGFYIGCQVNPETALEGYVLDAHERRALANPETLASVLSERGGTFALPRISITISGKHDWVNRTLLTDPAIDPDERTRRVEGEVAAIRQAAAPEGRKQAAIRLMALIG
jgi:hypothetical protein